MKVIVTGASGVLGTAVYDAFKSAGHETLGLAFSRPTGELKKVDLLNQGEADEVFVWFKPDCVPYMIRGCIALFAKCTGRGYSLCCREETGRCREGVCSQWSW